MLLYEMENKLYTSLNCGKCQQTKSLLDSKKIPYQEINIGTKEGKENFIKLYSIHRDEIKREENGAVILPVLFLNDKIYSGLEDTLNSIK